jgi:hypothetical protein
MRLLHTTDSDSHAGYFHWQKNKIEKGDSSGRIMPGLLTGHVANLGSISGRLTLLLFVTTPRSAVRHTYPYMQCVPGGFSPANRPELDTNCLSTVILLSNIKIYWSYSSAGRSQWPRSLRRRSVAAPLLGLRVRILAGPWVFFSCECCVFSGRNLCV